MNLIDYAISQGGYGTPSCPVLRRVAGRTGCAPRTLYLIARGHKLPGARLCRRIELETAGAVAREELRPDVFGPAPSPPAVRPPSSP
ncbi:YdaS family helix-turn-helix protein [Stenotrophomonas sp. 24(2023)]|uniref:YdaS family helix-turn-helix protein n=1 Tax=Stenotrophomonas sp. 24(2023) TaxID=3068324 RepID=UPI0027E08952|nr:YdaS family helix-turn-helix protein [Stenotrophomonas sp. 24(2023)]WMJ70233.1 YdaS family helix-turn-helix protein [Stenotrophomonas sp. 24(2023)]